MKKKIIWIVVLLVGAILVLIYAKKKGWVGKEEGIKVTAEKAELRTIIETVNASGKVYPEIEVKVSPDVSGEIVELNVNEGDSVVKGQILARIYADILLSQRDQVMAGVNQTRAQLANSQASIAGQKAQVDNLKVIYERQKKLLNEKVISRAEYEQAEQNLLTATANYNAAREGIKSSEASIQSALAQLQRADKDLSRTVITSPMSGIISLMNVKKGERVAGNSFNIGTEMMRVADMRSIEVRVDVGENDIPKVKLGDTALIEVDAYSGRKFKGLVYKIANPSTTLGGAAANTEVTSYKVHIRLLSNSYSDLMKSTGGFPFRPGMNASTDIQTNRRINVLSVPLNAVTPRDKSYNKADKTKTTENGSTESKKSIEDDDMDLVVFVLQPNQRVKQVKVNTAIQDLNFIEILGGIKSGDQVITGPYSVVSKTLKDSSLVKVVAKEQLFEDKKSQ
ncbi:MAG: efflux RND transporter periplasmic adaptor subunit [Sediminibacterium sp.]